MGLNIKLSPLKIEDYAKIGKKFCEGVCDRRIVEIKEEKFLVCDGCKRIVIKL